MNCAYKLLCNLIELLVGERVEEERRADVRALPVLRAQRAARRAGGEARRRQRVGLVV